MISPSVRALSTVCSTVGALDGWLYRDRKHDVRNDQYLQAQEDRPADILSGAPVGGRGAPAKVDRCPHQGQERTDDENRHAGDLEAVDYPFHCVVKVQPASPDVTGTRSDRCHLFATVGPPRWPPLRMGFA